MCRIAIPRSARRVDVSMEPAVSITTAMPAACAIVPSARALATHDRAAGAAEPARSLLARALAWAERLITRSNEKRVRILLSTRTHME
jgi:hypothetical protein